MKNRKIRSVKESAGASTHGQTNPPHRILVVDDNHDARQLSVDVLAEAGYDVDAAKDGAAGWEAIRANGYDLVITDNKMPKMTGIEMIEKLRSACIISRVIMATGHLPVHEFARKPWLKPDAMLERPFSNDVLLAAVKKVLGPDDDGGGHRETLLLKYL